MKQTPDFDFGFGKDRYLKGYGWRGIIALALVLAILLAILLLATKTGVPAIDDGIKLLGPGIGWVSSIFKR
jgi:hypothetical protein